jgi:glycerol-3-phosphate dehydrogenase (NAD(P)+)
LPPPLRVAVLGAGSWGTTLATLLSDSGGHDVSLWEIDELAAERLARQRENPYLGVRIPGAVDITSDLQRAVHDRAFIVLATPSEYLRPTLRALSLLDTPFADPFADYPFAEPLVDAPSKPTLVCAAKGLEARTGLTLDRVIADIFPDNPLALLSGPTFAKEIATGLPAAVVVASASESVAAEVQSLFGTARFRVYTTDDVVGVALGGALKNVVAIAVGVSDGLGFGGNARAALITRGLSEMGRLAVKLGAHPMTMAGLAGLGDLVLTCTGDLSRNRQVGLALARGERLTDIVRRLGQVAEGVTTARTAVMLAGELGVSLPIISAVSAVLHDGKPAREAVAQLLSRDSRAERDPGP